MDNLCGGRWLPCVSATSHSHLTRSRVSACRVFSAEPKVPKKGVAAVSSRPPGSCRWRGAPEPCLLGMSRAASLGSTWLSYEAIQESPAPCCGLSLTPRAGDRVCHGAWNLGEGDFGAPSPSIQDDQRACVFFSPGRGSFISTWWVILPTCPIGLFMGLSPHCSWGLGFRQDVAGLPWGTEPWVRPTGLEVGGRVGSGVAPRSSPLGC